MAQSATATDISARNQMSTGKVVAYSLGDVGNNLSFLMTSNFLMVYLTDIVGISAAMAGTIYAITKIWAGATDLVAGNTVDKTNTKWGRLRPWVLFGSLPLAMVLVGLFSVPGSLSDMGKLAWVFAFDAAFQLCYSFVNIPYGSLSAAMTQHPIDRARLSGARSIASSVTGVVLSFVVSPQFQGIQGLKGDALDAVRLKFTITTLILACVAIVMYVLCFLNTRETVKKPPVKSRLSTTFKMVGKNPPLLVLCLAALFLLSAMFTMNAVSVYYVRNVLGNASFYTILMIAQSVGTISSASLVPTLARRLGKRMAYLVMATIVVIGYVIVFFAPGGSWVGGAIAFLVFGFGVGGTNTLMFAMQADTVDYGQWKTGVRSEGGAYSILSFTRKCGQGIGGAVGAGILQMFGYSAAVIAQKSGADFDKAIQGIRLAAGLAPAVLGIVAALVIFFYPLNEKKYAEIVEDLRVRQEEMDKAQGAQPA